jgi:fructose-1,6-bisphosphatase/inositol monophosphatase family enzyme
MSNSNPNPTEKIFGFLENAGKIAEANRRAKNLDVLYTKSENPRDVVTKTDRQINDEFDAFVKKEFGAADPFALGEESAAGLGKEAFKNMLAAKYVFVIDPIDGTAPYSVRLPNYTSISIGVFKNKAPVFGAVYAPYSGVLTYADASGAYLVEDFNKPRPYRQKLARVPDDVETTRLFGDNPQVAAPKMDYNYEYNPVNGYSTAINLSQVASGQLAWHPFGWYIWDAAGVMAAFNHVGVEIRDYHTGEIFNPFEEGVLDDKFRVKNLHIASRPRYYEYAKNVLVDKMGNNRQY